MAKYILVKKVKGQKFEYQVIDTESKAIVSKRTSARDYVACTADGSFYFGRLDLIGKGDHGKRLSHTAAILANPEAAYKKQVAYFTPDYRSKWIAENPAEQWIARKRSVTRLVMTGRISTNGAIVNLEYMIKKITPDAMK